MKIKINNYQTYFKKDWKNNKGRFVNSQEENDEFILPVDDVDLDLIKLFMKIKCIVNKEYVNIHSFKYHNAELK
jgi:hypothetical protein